jgi:hypothetical protein
MCRPSAVLRFFRTLGSHRARPAHRRALPVPLPLRRVDCLGLDRCGEFFFPIFVNYVATLTVGTLGPTFGTETASTPRRHCRRGAVDSESERRLPAALLRALANRQTSGSIPLVAQRKTAHKAPWTKEDVRELKAHSKVRTPLPVIAKKMKRTERALRRKAGILCIGLRHRR